MKARLSAVLLVPFFLLSSISPSDASEGIVAIHLLGKTTDSLLVELGDNIPALAEQGIDLIFLEVDYSFDFQSHPELRQGDR